jgi:hypothetical protein
MGLRPLMDCGHPLGRIAEAELDPKPRAGEAHNRLGGNLQRHEFCENDESPSSASGGGGPDGQAPIARARVRS